MWVRVVVYNNSRALRRKASRVGVPKIDMSHIFFVLPYTLTGRMVGMKCFVRGRSNQRREPNLTEMFQGALKKNNTWKLREERNKMEQKCDGNEIKINDRFVLLSLFSSK